MTKEEVFIHVTIISLTILNILNSKILLKKLVFYV